MMRFATLATGLRLLIPASAILVAENSPCGTLCGNVLDATTPSDITCSESSYMSGNGAVYQQCVSCELSSTYHTSDNETDTEWLLYNVRYAAAYCLFGVPNNKDVLNTPCLTSTACGPFRDSIVLKNLSSKVSGYDYCNDWPANRRDEFSGCTDCLQAGSEYYLANFITVLQAGCEQRPIPGITLSLDGSVFSDDIVNITSPTPTASVNPAWFDQGPVSLGGKVGIAFAGFAVLLFILGFFIIWNGKRRRRAFLRKIETKHNSWPGPIDTSPGGMRETPLSQKPLRGWDDSPMSTRSEKPFHHHVSPFSSHYNSPVSATELRLSNWPVMGAHPEYQMPIQTGGSPYGMVPSPQHQMTPATFASSSTMVPHSQYQMTPPVQASPSPAVVAHGSEVSSLSSSNSRKGKEVQESYEMQPVEGGTHQMTGDQQHAASNYSMQQQAYFESQQVNQHQFHPGQMFPNMYQQQQQQLLQLQLQQAQFQRGSYGFEDDVKK